MGLEACSKEGKKGAAPTPSVWGGGRESDSHGMTHACWCMWRYNTVVSVLHYKHGREEETGGGGEGGEGKRKGG